MRCAWCSTEATTNGTVPACDDHKGLLDEIENDRWRMRRCVTFALLSDDPHWQIEDDALRVAPLDWTQPVAGWVLFAPVE